jgi:elongator complex protein 1
VEGAALQAELQELEAEVKEGIEEVWKTPGEDGQGEADGWAARMAAVERARAINPLDKISKPVLEATSSWKMRLYED